MSPIEGNGLAATAVIPAGEIVARLGGRIVADRELTLLLAAAGRQGGSSYVDTITVDDDAHLVLPDGEAVHFLNHSCDPNVGTSTPSPSPPAAMWTSARS